MSWFEVGDTIVCVDSRGNTDLRAGRKYVAREIDNEGMVRVGVRDKWHDGSRFEFYSKPGATPAAATETDPAHYTKFSIEPIDAIESWGLGFRLANVVKYVARADHKENTLRDLRKAAWYLDREIAKREAGES